MLGMSWNPEGSTDHPVSRLYLTADKHNEQPVILCTGPPLTCGICHSLRVIVQSAVHHARMECDSPGTPISTLKHCTSLQQEKTTPSTFQKTQSIVQSNPAPLPHNLRLVCDGNFLKPCCCCCCCRGPDAAPDPAMNPTQLLTGTPS